MRDPDAVERIGSFTGRGVRVCSRRGNSKRVGIPESVEGEIQEEMTGRDPHPASAPPEQPSLSHQSPSPSTCLSHPSTPLPFPGKDKDKNSLGHAWGPCGRGVSRKDIRRPRGGKHTSQVKVPSFRAKQVVPEKGGVGGHLALRLVPSL